MNFSGRRNNFAAQSARRAGSPRRIAAQIADKKRLPRAETKPALN